MIIPIIWLFRVSLLVLLCGATAAVANAAPVYDVSEATPLNYVADSSKQANYAAVATNDAALTISQRLSKLENQLANFQQENVLQRVADLQAEIQGLRSQLESLVLTVNNIASNIANKTIAQTSDTQSGIATVKESPIAVKQNTNVQYPAKISNAKIGKEVKDKENNKNKLTVNQPDSNDKIAASAAVSETVYNFIKAEKYQQAVNYLRTMLHKYPNGTFAANMHYWLGDLYGLLGKHEQASVEFLAVIQNDPHNEHCADAELKLGLIYKMQHNLVAAKAMFNKVISRHPNTSAASLASAQLNKN